MPCRQDEIGFLALLAQCIERAGEAWTTDTTILINVTAFQAENVFARFRAMLQSRGYGHEYYPDRGRWRIFDYDPSKRS